MTWASISRIGSFSLLDPARAADISPHLNGSAEYARAEFVTSSKNYRYGCTKLSKNNSWVTAIDLDVYSVSLYLVSGCSRLVIISAQNHSSSVCAHEVINDIYICLLIRRWTERGEHCIGRGVVSRRSKLITRNAYSKI
jgi:hypothetical protein